MLAAALLGHPPALILDEPFNGMDPESIVWMRGYLRTLAGQGRAVLVSSHLTSELEDTADHLVVAGRGRVIAGTSARQLLAAASGSRIRLRTTAPARAATALTGAGSTAAPEPGVLNDLQPLFRTDRSSPDPAHDPVHRGDRPPAGGRSQAYPELTRESAGFRAAGAA